MTGNLTKHHRRELSPPVEGMEFLLNVMYVGKIIKIMSRNKYSNFVKYYVLICRELDIFVIIIVFTSKV